MNSVLKKLRIFAINPFIHNEHNKCWVGWFLGRHKIIVLDKHSFFWRYIGYKDWCTVKEQIERVMLSIRLAGEEYVGNYLVHSYKNLELKIYPMQGQYAHPGISSKLVSPDSIKWVERHDFGSFFVVITIHDEKRRIL